MSGGTSRQAATGKPPVAVAHDTSLPRIKRLQHEASISHYRSKAKDGKCPKAKVPMSIQSDEKAYPHIMHIDNIIVGYGSGE